VFFVVDHANREVLHVQTTRHPTVEWASRQIIECCDWDREPPRFRNISKTGGADNLWRNDRA
jgi:hypothetical protein